MICNLPPTLDLIPFSAANHPLLLQQVQEPIQFAIVNTREAVPIEAEIFRLVRSQLLRFRGPLRPFRLLRRGACGADRDGYLLGLHRLCWRKGEEALRGMLGKVA